MIQIFFLALLSLSLFAQEPCESGGGENLQNKRKRQGVLQQKSQELEKQLKEVLQDEILAQVEKRSPSGEPQASGKLYYELRRVREELSAETLQLRELQKKYCQACPETLFCKESPTP